MPFDPTKPYTEVKPAFDPSKPYTDVSAPSTDDITHLYRGTLKDLDTRLSPDQQEAFKALDVDPDPLEARARMLNQVYLGDKLKDMGPDDIEHNWPSVKQAYMKEMGDETKDPTDQQLYNLISDKERGIGEVRAPTTTEHLSTMWDRWTGGIFSAGPQARPLADGVKPSWHDVMTHDTGALVSMGLNPGNLLAAASGVGLAGRAPGLVNALSKTVGVYMIGNSAYNVPSIWREWNNPDVNAAQATGDTAMDVTQAALGFLALKGPKKSLTLPKIDGITSAAIRRSDGTIATGPSHAAIGGAGDHGFMLTNGEFVNRTDAMPYARMAGQLKDGVTGDSLHSQHIAKYVTEPVPVSTAAPHPMDRVLGHLGEALMNMPEEDATRMVAQLTGATPEEAAQVLQSHSAQQSPEVASHLTQASQAMQHLSDLEPQQVKDLVGVARGWDQIKRVFAPSSRGPLADITAGALREYGGNLAHRIDLANETLKGASNALMKLSPEDRWAVIHRLETGQQEPNAQMQAYSDTMKEILATKREEIRALGTGKLEHFIDDYFPHIWADPEAAAKVFGAATAKNPLEGGKSFLKQRTIPTIQEGMARGLKPITDNPVDMVLLKAREMDKYILAQRFMAEMKEREFVKFVQAGSKAPDGYMRLDDKIARVYGNPSHPGAMQIEGEYWAPGEIAGVVNNYLSPGWGGKPLFKAYMSLANSLNQAQLGISGFHLTTTAVNSATSRLALAIQYASEGKVIKAAGLAARTATAPIENLVTGSRMLRESIRPGTQGGDIAQMVDEYYRAGGRMRMDASFRTSYAKNFKAMWKQMTQAPTALGKAGGAWGTLWRALPAGLETTMHPTMEWFVPRMKAGVAADMMRFELSKLPEGANVETVRKAIGGALDSVDNRMGQMVYDNLFWNKVVKDLAMAITRSVGWNLGTIREIGGGIVDTGKFAKDAVTPGQKAEFTRRMAFTVAMPVITGMMGATYTYLRTGKAPEDLMSYWFPKTGEQDPQGRDVRINLPGYMKDVFHYAHDPVGTLEGKANPAITMGIEMLNNKDFFGRDIRNADDPWMQQLIDSAKYVGKTALPISVKQFQVSNAAKVSAGEQAVNFFGVTRAPSYMSETPAEQLAGKLAGDKFKSPTSPDSDLVVQKQQIQQGLRSGDEQKQLEAEDALDELVDQQKMTQQQAKNLRKGTEHTYLENAISHLDAREVMRVFKQANTAERFEMADTVEKKIESAHLPDDDKDALRQQFEKLLPMRSDLPRDPTTSQR